MFWRRNKEGSKDYLPHLFSYKGWNILLLYSLFSFSTFSIAGSDVSITGLYLVFLLRSIKKPYLRKISHPIFLALVIFFFFNILSGIVSPYPAGAGFAIRDNLRLFLPLVLYFALDDIDDQRLLQVFFFFLILVSIYGVITTGRAGGLKKPPGWGQI